MNDVEVAKPPTLSICIPTYNFGQFIGETLASVLTQVSPSVEIVVLDGASTDCTASVVESFQATYACLRYERALERGGIDRDLAKIVELAKGDYCWLFSADDLMQPGAVSSVLVALSSQQDIYLCMHSDESFSMQLLRERHSVLALSEDTSFRLNDPVDLMRYFESAQTTEAFFSFMGGLIVKRAKWSSVSLNESFVGTCWAHVARLFELMPRGLTLRYLASPLVRRRNDNDSFATQGLVRRYELALRGFHKLAKVFFGSDSPQAFHIRRVLTEEFGLRVFWRAKAACASNPGLEDIKLLNELVNETFCDQSLANVMRRVAYRLLPARGYGPILALYLGAAAILKHKAFRNG